MTEVFESIAKACFTAKSWHVSLRKQFCRAAFPTQLSA